jgi:chorismate synthase
MSLRLLTAGESHGPELVLILEGMPAGVPVHQDEIDRQLRRRQGGHGRGARSTRIEQDHAEIVSGVASGETTGAPIAIRIVNKDHGNQPLTKPLLTTPRPGHADLAGAIKYGVSDLRLIRERASARETAARVAAGALVRPLLQALGAEVLSFVTAIGRVEAPVDLARSSAAELHRLAAAAEPDPVRCFDPQCSALMVEAVDAARVGRETLGGVFVVAATGIPVGLGSHAQWDRRLDAQVAAAVLSIPAVKGVEIGPAFQVASLRGTEAQDPILGSGGARGRASNFAGGVEGGMSNGEPLVVMAAMKPLSSVRAPLLSVDLVSGAQADPPYIRSDICAVPAAAVVGEAVVAVVLAKAALERFGGDRLDAILAAAEVGSRNPFPGTPA